MTSNITAALRPIAPRWRRAIRDELVRRDLPTSGPLNRHGRKALEDVIFAVENDLEHRSVANGGSAHPRVAIMRAVRNVLLDEIPPPPIDVGNETRKDGRPRWPWVEAVAAVMHERRRRGGRFPPVSVAPECTSRGDVASDGSEGVPDETDPESNAGEE